MNLPLKIYTCQLEPKKCTEMSGSDIGVVLIVVAFIVILLISIIAILDS